MKVGMRRVVRPVSLAAATAMLVFSGVAWAEEPSLQSPAQDGMSSADDQAVALQEAPDRRERRREAAAAAIPRGALTLKGTSDGTIHVLDADGHVQASYPPGSLILSEADHDVVARMQARREQRQQQAKERQERRVVEREQAARDAEEAKKKRREDEEERQAAAEKANLEASAILLKDAKTGEFMRAVPTWRLPAKTDAPGRSPREGQAETKDRPPTRRFYDRRKGRYIQAAPLNELLKTSEQQ